MFARTLLGLCLLHILALGGIPTAIAGSPESHEIVLHNFTGAPDGESPYGGVVEAPSGKLYGTTIGGGANYFGSVFELSKLNGVWSETVIYSFQGSLDGGAPEGNLILDKAGNIYGTASFFGNGLSGTVFELTPNGGGWTETTLYTFMGSLNGTDGAFPSGGLIFDKAGNIYGTTAGGGGTTVCPNQAGGCGTVFELMKSNEGWTEKVLYSFQGGTDGSDPVGSVIFGKAADLYGTSQGGEDGFGAVFELTRSAGKWTESLIHSFTSTNGDGAQPAPDLVIDRAGNLYGLAGQGGNAAGCTIEAGCGIAFQFVPTNGSWQENILFSFDGSDGSSPYGISMDQTGDIFGSTIGGGTGDLGTIFNLTNGVNQWIETSVYDFPANAKGGASPNRIIVDKRGNIYGTTIGSRDGYGLAFEVKP